jgi:hypothetical protein
VQAIKLLFLQSPGNHPEIPSDLYINGVISSVPWHGHHEYGIMWDTSVLPVALEKSAICHAISKTDHQRINMSKMTCFTFDRVYPDGMKGVPNLAPLPRIRNRSQPRRAVAPTATAAKTGRTRDAVILREI